MELRMMKTFSKTIAKLTIVTILHKADNCYRPFLSFLFALFR